jgi:hypothetical protein
MIAFIGSICAVLVAYGGGMLEHNFLLGAGLVSLGTVGLGTIVAHLQANQDMHAGIEVRDGLNLTQLWLFLNNRVELTGDTKLYIGDQGLNPAGAVFTAILDGQRVVVIERKGEEKQQAVVTATDLF